MSVIKYSYKSDKNKNVSTHFKVYEFASFINGSLYSDEILIDSVLVNKLEEIFKQCNCSKAIISSGYRTSTGDRAVGGSGTGQHVLGKAVDICFYDLNNKVIPAEIICCIAQDLNFKGIAYITNSYVHLDNRDTGTYKGDERTGTHTVTNNFYKYFNLSNNDVSKYLKEKKNTPNITYQVYTNKWYPNVTNLEDYAGVFNNSITAVYANLSEGDITYKVHTKNGKWLKEVKNREDYAGIFGQPIDAIMFKSSIKTAKYRVHLKNGNWLSWVTGYNQEDSINGYAGIFNREIDALEIEII